MINKKLRFFMLLLVLALPLTISNYASRSTEEVNSDLYIDPNYTDSLNHTFRSVSAIPVGVAINTNLLRYNQQYRNIVAHHFSSLTPENVMKMESLVPLEGTYDWSNADLLVDFSEQIDALVHGHTLVWHSQLPFWVDSYS